MSCISVCLFHPQSLFPPVSSYLYCNFALCVLLVSCLNGLQEWREGGIIKQIMYKPHRCATVDTSISILIRIFFSGKVGNIHYYD